jgi:hypothetical protein
MSNNDSWMGKTNGKEVWAVNLDNGTSKRFLSVCSSPVRDVMSDGEEISIITEDGRVQVWNPATGSQRTIR